MREPFVATVPARYARELLAAVKAALANIDADIGGGGTVAPFMLEEARDDELVQVIIVDASTAINALMRKSA